MGFIELLFHVSPDHGSGLTEALVVSTVVAFIASVHLRRKRSRLDRAAQS